MTWSRERAGGSVQYTKKTIAFQQPYSSPVVALYEPCRSPVVAM